VLFVSGYPESRGGQQQLDSATAFLPKPFAPEVLASKVREILDRHQARPKP
jgi:DNA-binding response OmpR family regulator